MNGRFVSYLRVSTARQGRSGLGLEAQREAVRGFLNGGTWELVAEFVEVESGTNKARPQLAAALAKCRLLNATLVVAKLDRLSRDFRLVEDVLEDATLQTPRFCDLPNIPDGPVGRFLLQQMASVAQLEAGLISQRTKAALAAAKARGSKLGGYRGGPAPDPAAGLKVRQDKALRFAATVRPTVEALRAEGKSLRAIAAELTSQGVATPRKGAWTAAAVNAILA